jgi:hypothetical protein
MDEIKGDWRKLPNVELNNLYLSVNIIRMTVSRRLRWLEHVGCIREECIQNFGKEAEGTGH